MTLKKRKVRNTVLLLLTVIAVVLIAACVGPSVEYQNTPVQKSDKDLLKEKIDEASDLHDSLEVCFDGSTVDPDLYWVEENLKYKLYLALEDAVLIHGKEDASKEEISYALQGLLDALDAAHKAKQNGTRPPSEKDALVYAIADALEKMEDVKKSSDGNDVPDNGKWANSEMFAALENVIASAETLFEKEKATQAEVDAMIAELEAAIKAFVPNTANVKRASLKTEIDKAQTLHNDVDVKLQVSEDGSDVHKSREWVTPSAVKEFEDAINTASSIYIKADASQNEVNAAVQNLQNASNKFFNGKQSGKNEIDRFDLSKAIEKAEAKLADVVIAENGSTVLNSLEWVKQEMFDALKAVLDEAVELFEDDLAIQEDVDAMATILETAVKAFAPKPGLLTSGGISYVFNQPQDENIVLSNTQTLSWVKNDQLKITVAGSYDSYLWTYIDCDNVIKTSTNNSLEVRARDFGVGTYSISLRVTKNSVPYTKTLTFIVE